MSENLILSRDNVVNLTGNLLYNIAIYIVFSVRFILKSKINVAIRLIY